MEVSLNTAYICTIGSLEKTLNAFKKAGFKTFDFSLSYIIEQCDTYIDKDDYLEKTKKLKEYADKLGLHANQAHSFMKYRNKAFSRKENLYCDKMLLRSIEMASIMGAKYIIVHPFSSYDELKNVKMFKDLANFAKSHNIKIAIENMPRGLFSEEDGINSLLDKINDDNVVLCLDIGHAYLPKEKKTNATNIIRKCSKYLKCLHIHDNDECSDLHTLPGLGKINFDEICKALKEINYEGDLTFEVDGYLYNSYPVDQRDLGLPQIYKCGEELMNKIK